MLPSAPEEKRDMCKAHLRTLIALFEDPTVLRDAEIAGMVDELFDLALDMK